MTIQVEYWETKFKKEGTAWSFEPSDSALIALGIFQANNINKILIPGVGYGRNAKLFLDKGFDITGIEISQTAIDLAKENGLNYKVYSGSVTSMPFDTDFYDGVFCYATIHLLNKAERKAFLTACYKQLRNNGIMVFTVISTASNMYGTGRKLSKDRYEITKGLEVYFYDSKSVIDEFYKFNLIDCRDIEEPIKHIDGHEPLKCKLVICKKK